MRAFQSAAESRLEAVWSPDRVFPVGQVPDSPPNNYAVVSVSSPSYTSRRSDGTAGGEGHRIVVQFVGRTVDDVAWGVDLGAEAFMGGHRLSVAGWDCSPVDPDGVVASQIYRDPDGGAWLLATVVYPFTAYPTA